jgi:hypothetical protein
MDDGKYRFAGTTYSHGIVKESSTISNSDIRPLPWSIAHVDMSIVDADGGGNNEAFFGLREGITRVVEFSWLAAGEQGSESVW